MQVHYLADFPEHIPQVAEWLHKEWAYLDPDRSLEDTIEQCEAYLNYNQMPLSLIMVKGEKLLGVVSLVLYDMDTHPEIPYWLSALHVSPDSRCRGVGQKLVEWCVRKATHMGIDTLHLATPTSKVADWYRKLGWDFCEVTDYHGTEVTVFNKVLNEVDTMPRYGSEQFLEGMDFDAEEFNPEKLDPASFDPYLMEDFFAEMKDKKT